MRAVFTCLLDQVSLGISFLLFSFLPSVVPITNILSHLPSFYRLQVSLYITEGLERARDSLTEAAALREKFVLGTLVSRRVAAAAASAVITCTVTSYVVCIISLWGGGDCFMSFVLLNQFKQKISYFLNIIKQSL